MAIITITGENDFARSQALRQLVADFVATEGDLALERLDGEETDFRRIQEAVTSLPFLANKKMVVLSAPAKSKQFCEQLDRLLPGLPDTTELVLYEPKFDKRSSLYKTLKKQTDFRDYAALDTNALARWLVDEAQKRGSVLNPADARYLIDRVGSHQQLLASEIEKLSLAATDISKAVIDDLTEAAPQSTVFQLLDAAFAGNRQLALRLYQEQRTMKVEPQQIVGMFAWQLHIMAVVKAAGSRPATEIAQKSRINPYVVGKTQALTRGMTLKRLGKVLDDLLSIDRRSKRESIDLDEALQHFVLSLA